MAEVRWHTYPKGTRHEAESAARELQDSIGGTVRVGDFLEGIQAWELFVSPPTPTCDWTDCYSPFVGRRTDGHTVKQLCRRHLDLTSRSPH